MDQMRAFHKTESEWHHLWSYPRVLPGKDKEISTEYLEGTTILFYTIDGRAH